MLPIELARHSRMFHDTLAATFCTLGALHPSAPFQRAPLPVGGGMFRNQYDTDVVTFSPQGRIHQVEYAMEAVKQGSVLVGLTSKHGVVLASLKRAANELSSYQRKIFQVDKHIGLGMSGLTADGRQLLKFMRNECTNHRFVYECGKTAGRLVKQVADRSQVSTQRSWARPYGVGLLVATFDQTGPHLYQTCPSGNFYEYKAIAMGARSQAARTYMEKQFDQFPECTIDELCHYALLALRESTSDGNVNAQNASLAFVGPHQDFTVLDDDDVSPYIQRLATGQEQGGAQTTSQGEGDQGPQPMES